MACLSTSGRRGLCVAIGARTKHQSTQKFLCQLFVHNNLSRHIGSTAALGQTTQSNVAQKNINKSYSPCGGAGASSSSSSPTTSSTAILLMQPTQRHFHVLNKKDYNFGVLQSTIASHQRTTTKCHAHNDSNAVAAVAYNSNISTGNSSSSGNTNTSNRRPYSSVHTQQPAGPVREIQIDPYIIVDDELKYFYDDLRELLSQGTSQADLDKIATYYFDGQGKALRPMVTMLMAKALNYHLNKESSQLLDKQRQIALFSEMVHSASLVHDDVIDQSDFRRGKPSVNILWNHKKVTMAGDYILAVASLLIARLKCNEVTIVLSQILTDLVQGEFMQLGSKETENERFAHYLTKTYRKTASLIANTLKATAVIAEADDEVVELAFQYGRNIGLAFQLVDDMLDFVSSTETMGKPTAADLKLGLATAPVLFACEKYPELNPMIMRRFAEPGDVERAFELVHKSHGLEQTRFLAKKHCIEAIRLAQEMSESPYQKGLQVVADLVINRMK